MTEKDLEKIFTEANAEVYSPEYRKIIEERIGTSEAVEGLALALKANHEQNKAFLFRVFAKALCNKS